VIVSGHMVAEFGKPVTIFGKTATMFRAEGGFTVDKNHLDIDAEVWLGAYVQNGKTAGVLGSGSGNVHLDWNAQDYSAKMHASMLDGVYTFDASFEFNGAFDALWISATASVNVPNGVPFIGGTHLASMDFRLSYVGSDMSQSYVASWVTINLLI